MQNSEHLSHQKKKLSSWILDYDKNAYCDPKIPNDSRELLVDSFNECSDLRKSFHNSLNEFFSNLGFSSMNPFHKYDNSFTNFEKATHEIHKDNLRMDIGFSLIKDNSELNLKNKKKIKDKGKNVISLKKKILKKDIENFINNDVIESDDEDSDEKKIDKNKKENNGDYFLNSIYNQFGISNKNKFRNTEESKDNQLYIKKESKMNRKGEKNKYSENITDNDKLSENQNKFNISLLNTDKKEKIKENISKKINDKKSVYEEEKVAEKNKNFTDKKIINKNEKEKKERDNFNINKKYSKKIISKEIKQINDDDNKKEEMKIDENIKYKQSKDDNNNINETSKITYNKKIKIENNKTDKNINLPKKEKEEIIKRQSHNLKLKADINLLNIK